MTASRRLLLRLGTECNSRCPHCTIRDLAGLPERGTEAALAEIRAARAAGCDELVIMRGEATLRPDLPSLLATARDLGFRHVQLQTNGRRLADPAFLDRLAAAGVTFFEISLYGPDDRVHDAIAGAAGAFDETTRGIANCLARDVEVLATVPVVRANVDRLGETVVLLGRLGARAVQLNLTRPIDGGMGVVATLAEAVPAVRAAVLLGRHLGLHPRVEALPPCLLGGVEDALLKFDPAPVRIVDLHRTVTDLTELRQAYRPLTPTCRPCARADECPVTWAGYLEGPAGARVLQAFPRARVASERSERDVRPQAAARAHPKEDEPEADLWLVRPPWTLVEETVPRQWGLLGLVPDAAPSRLEAAAGAGFAQTPGGLESLRRHLEARGASVRAADLAALYLGAEDAYDRTRAHLAGLGARVVAVELRWLVQCQGALEVLGLWRRLHPGARTVLFGRAAGPLARAVLEQCDSVDFVVAGEGARPLRRLLGALLQGGSLEAVPQLWYRRRGRVAYTGTATWPGPEHGGDDIGAGGDPVEVAAAIVDRLGGNARLRLVGDPVLAFGVPGWRRFLAAFGPRGRDLELDLDLGVGAPPGAAVIERLSRTFRSVRLTLRAGAGDGSAPLGRRGPGEAEVLRCLGAVAAHDNVRARLWLRFGLAHDDAASLARTLELMRHLLTRNASRDRVEADCVERWYEPPGAPEAGEPAARGRPSCRTDLDAIGRGFAAPLFSGAVRCSPGGLTRREYLALILRKHAEVNRLFLESGRRREEVARRVRAYVDVVSSFLDRYERFGPGGAGAPAAEAHRLGREMRDAFLERTLGGPAPRSSAAQVPAPRASSATSRFARVSIAAVQREALVAALGLDPGQVRRLLGGLGELQVEVAAGTLTLTPAGSVRTPAARTDAFDLDGPADPVTAVAPLLRAVEREHPERLPRLFAPMQERPPEARLEAALAGEKVEELVRVTMACNQRCLFCSVDPRHERSHDPDTVRAFIRGRAGGPFIVFSGGEPTLDQRLPGYLRLARDAGYPDIVLQTNALRCAYPAYARKLAESGLRSAFVSLHSHLAKVSDGLTRTPGTFDLTLRGIDALLGAGVMVWLNFVATARNVTGAAEFVRFAQGRFAGLAGICFSLMAPVGVGGRVPTLWPRLRVAGPSFAAALRAATMAGIPAKVPEVCGLPLCLLPGLERFSEALRSLPADAPAQPDRTHVAACARCRWRPVCSGYWKVYLARHGEAEIVACQGPTPG